MPALATPNPMEHYDGSMEALRRNRSIVNDSIRKEGGTPTAYDHAAVDANMKKFKDHVQGGFSLTSEELMMTVIKTIQYQDPMEPEKPGEVTKMFAMASMTSTFADARQDIGAMKDLVSRGMALKANSMIGQTVEAEHNIFKYSGEGSAELGFNLPFKAQQVEVSIYDDKEGYVRRLIVKDGETLKINGKDQKIDLKMGRNDIPWDGLRDNATPAEAGKYRFRIRPLDQSGSPLKDPDTGKPPTIPTYIRGTMESSFMNEQGNSRMLIDGIEMPLSAFHRSFGIISESNGVDNPGPSVEHPMPHTTQPAQDSRKAHWQQKINTLQKEFQTEKNKPFTKNDLPPGLADI